jgi:uncharacterized protein (DUF697 family)
MQEQVTFIDRVAAERPVTSFDIKLDVLKEVAKMVCPIRGRRCAIDITQLIRNFLVWHANEWASQAVGSARRMAQNALGSLRYANILGGGPSRGTVVSMQQQEIANFMAKCTALHPDILNEIPAEIKLCRRTIKRGIKSSVKGVYRRQLTITEAMVRQAMKAEAQATLQMIEVASGVAFAAMSSRDLEKSQVAYEHLRYQAMAKGDFKTKIRALNQITPDPPFTPYFNEVSRELNEWVEQSVLIRWQRQKMTNLVHESSRLLAIAAGCSVCPFLDWVWVGMIWRGMMRQLAKVPQVALSADLVSNCVDEYKTLAQFVATTLKFIPIIGTLYVGFGAAVVGEIQTERFGQACIDAILEWRTGETADKKKFQTSLAMHTRWYGLRKRDMGEILQSQLSCLRLRTFRPPASGSFSHSGSTEVEDVDSAVEV